jgi:hypothetical protein
MAMRMIALTAVFVPIAAANIVQRRTTATTTNADGHTAYHTYTASLVPLSNSGVSGEIAIFVTSSGLVGVGSATGLEANLVASPSGVNCTAKNGCGVHVHSGASCTSSSSQGGHYYDVQAVDPWATVRYSSTNATGSASFTFSVLTNFKAIDGKPFIVHNNAGGRVACGILTQRVGTTSASLMPLSSSGVKGGVTLYATSSMIVGAGWASGLEANLSDSASGGANCTAKKMDVVCTCIVALRAAIPPGKVDISKHLMVKTLGQLSGIPAPMLWVGPLLCSRSVPIIQK